ncbi:peroxiredoxin [Desulfovibrio sp. JC022]|uniref:peroxiredoxin family protein n=1 Tax=Desulfovibrio sp. JC022 TaxID=2593642 RepID=UPI0013D130C4|nr:TlpA disulfide reductase family protein [Desulfovibrio sp. JC022]NDV24357.1 TlpA family protein disulfide reductase [Desulfovibrio sp. JC022]
MHKIIFVLIILSLFVSSAAYAAPLQSGTNFPDIRLEGKLTGEQKKYLDLKGDGPWKISDIEADYLIIEVYSMYCPHCQREAPAVNSFCNLLSKSKECAEVKFIGLAAGNTEFEIDFFKEKFGVEFPIFADPELEIHDEIGQPGTPHFFMLKNEDGNFKIILSHEGPFESADKFIELIKDKL